MELHCTHAVFKLQFKVLLNNLKTCIAVCYDNVCHYCACAIFVIFHRQNNIWNYRVDKIPTWNCKLALILNGEVGHNNSIRRREGEKASPGVSAPKVSNSFTSNSPLRLWSQSPIDFPRNLLSQRLPNLLPILLLLLLLRCCFFFFFFLVISSHVARGMLEVGEGGRRAFLVGAFSKEGEENQALAGMGRWDQLQQCRPDPNPHS